METEEILKNELGEEKAKAILDYTESLKEEARAEIDNEADIEEKASDVESVIVNSTSERESKEEMDLELEDVREAINKEELNWWKDNAIRLETKFNQYSSELGTKNSEEYLQMLENGSIVDVHKITNKAIGLGIQKGDEELVSLARETKYTVTADRLNDIDNLSVLDKMQLNMGIHSPLKLSETELKDLTEKTYLTAVSAGMFHGTEEDVEAFKENIYNNLNRLNEKGMHGMLRKSIKDLNSRSQDVIDNLKQANMDKKQNYSDQLVSQRESQQVQESVEPVETKTNIVEQGDMQHENPEDYNREEPVEKPEQEPKEGQVGYTHEEILKQAETYALAHGFYFWNTEVIKKSLDESNWQIKRLDGQPVTITNGSQLASFLQKQQYMINEKVRDADFDKAVESVKNGKEVDFKNFYPTEKQFKSYCKKNNINNLNIDTWYKSRMDGGWKDSSGEQIKNWQGYIKHISNKIAQRNNQSNQMSMK